MDKEIKIVIDILNGKTNISISGLTSEQSSYFTPKILKILDEIEEQKAAQY